MRPDMARVSWEITHTCHPHRTILAFTASRDRYQQNQKEQLVPYLVMLAGLN